MVQPGLRDFVTAINAVAVFALVDAGECGHDARALGGAAAFGGLRHGLLLERVHAGETPDGLLVERHRLLTIRAQSILFLQSCEFVEQAGAIGFSFGR